MVTATSSTISPYVNACKGLAVLLLTLAIWLYFEEARGVLANCF